MRALRQAGPRLALKIDAAAIVLRHQDVVEPFAGPEPDAYRKCAVGEAEALTDRKACQDMSGDPGSGFGLEVHARLGRGHLRACAEPRGPANRQRVPKSRAEYSCQAAHRRVPLYRTNAIDVLLPPAHGGQFRSCLRVERLPIRLSAFERQQEFPMRLRHRSNDLAHQRFPCRQEFVEQHRLSRHPGKSALELGGYVVPPHSQHLVHWPIMVDEVDQESSAERKRPRQSDFPAIPSGVLAEPRIELEISPSAVLDTVDGCGVASD